MELNILFHTALFFEAQPLIEYYKLKQVFQLKNIKIYNKENTFLIISGTGLINTANSISIFFNLFNQQKKNFLCINIGIAASKELQLNNWFYADTIKMFKQRFVFYPSIVYPFESSKLITVTEIADSCLTNKYPEYMFDMEGYSFSKSVQFYQQNHFIHSFKYISDSGYKFLDAKNLQINYNNDFRKVLEKINTLIEHLKKHLIDENLLERNTLISDKINQLKITSYQKNQLLTAIKYYLNYQSLDKALNKLDNFKLQLSKNKKTNNQLFEIFLDSLYAF
ncbi:MAG: hypothetical protein ACK4IK_07525 [Bacteroidia bacterium]